MESPSMLNPTTNSVDLSTRKTMSLFHRYFFLIKGHYFLFFSAFGTLYPILNITLRSRGLSNTEISYINLIIPFIVFCTNPLCGFLADHTRRYLFVFNIILILATGFYLTLFLLPPIQTHDIQAKIISSNRTWLDFCASDEVGSKCSSRSECGCSYHANCQSINFTFAMNPTHINKKSDCGIDYLVPITQSHLSSSMTCQITCSVPHFCQGNRQSNQVFLIFAYSILFVLGTNCLSNAITLGASIGFAFLPRADLFGQQRVWGTIGFGLSAFLASLIYKIFPTEFVYIIMFSIVSVICIIVTSFIGIHPHKKHDNKKSEQELTELPVKNESEDKKSKLSILLPLLKKLDVIIFLSLTFIWGMSYAALDPYVYLYVDEIAPCYSHSVVGLMSLIASISEVLAFYLAASIIKCLGVNLSSITIFFAFALRFLGYYFVRRPYFLLFVESMHFFNFGILYVLIAQKADSIAPPGFSGTLQGIVYGVSFGLGRGIGLIASSFIYTRLQSRLLFLIFALFNVTAAVVYGIYFFVRREKSSKSQRLPINTNIPKIVIDPAESTMPEDSLLMSTSST